MKARWDAKIGRMMLSISLGVAIATPRLATADLETKTVVAEGMGAGNDKAKARDDAIAEAQQRAVEQVAGVYVNATTLVVNTELVRSEILTKSEGFIKSWEPVDGSERWENNGLFHIKIRAVVMMGKVRQAVESLCKDMKVSGNPRIIVTLEDVAPVDDGAQGAAKSFIEECLVSEGLRTLDTEHLQEVDRTNLERLQHMGESASIETLRLQNVADLIVLGKVSVKYLGQSDIPGFNDVHSTRCTIDAGIIQTDNAEIIARSRETATGAGFTREKATEESIKKAAKMWCDKNLCRLKVASVNPAKTYTIKLLRVATMRNVDGFLKSLGELRFVRDAQLRSFEQGVAAVEVQYASSPESLRKELISLIEIKSLEGRTFLGTVSANRSPE